MRSWRNWVAPALAAFAFAVCLAAFLVGLFHYQRQVRTWSRAELQSRAELAAHALAEPLRTLDYGEINRIAARLKEDGLRLRITLSRFAVSDVGRTPGFYDTLGEPASAHEPTCWGQAPAGAFRVGVGRPERVMMRPFRRALVVVLLSCALGVAGVVLFFFVTYRQHVRIRELARLESFRRAFIADFSHELKTPLTGILGAAEMLPGSDPLAAMIRRESKRLNALAEGVLDLARLEREGEVLACAPTDMAELVRERVQRFQPQAAARGVTLTCDTSAAEGLVLSCDALRIAEALDNLIANALRHSGSPSVAVALTDTRQVVRLSVEDHGTGIPAAERARVFERFYRLDVARTAEGGGTGLGLAIVRRIARLHGGDVALDAASPQGCRFTITLPKGGR